MQICGLLGTNARLSLVGKIFDIKMTLWHQLLYKITPDNHDSNNYIAKSICVRFSWEKHFPHVTSWRVYV